MTIGSSLDLVTKAANVVGVVKSVSDVGLGNTWDKIKDRFDLYDKAREELSSEVKKMSGKLTEVEGEVKSTKSLVEKILIKKFLSLNQWERLELDRCGGSEG